MQIKTGFIVQASLHLGVEMFTVPYVLLPPDTPATAWQGYQDGD